MPQIISMKQLPIKTLALAGLMTLGCGSTWASTNCTFTPVSPNASFIINNPLDIVAGDPALRQAVSYGSSNCSKRNIYVNGGFCIKMGLGSAGTPAGTAYAPRWLQKGTDYIGFQIYKDNAYSNIWGPNSAAPAQQVRETLSMLGSTAFADWTMTEITNKPGGFPLYMELLTTFPTVAGVSNLAMLAPGLYQSSFNSSNNTFWRAAYGAGTNADCSNGGENSGIQSINFSVQADIKAQCKIKGAVADIDFGTQSGTATNLQGSTALTVQCTRTTPYYIGLLPGNGNTAGAGVMYGQAPLTPADTVPYQLRSTAGMSGTIWGNTATSISVGNGVAGTGTGSDQNHTIYATLASANAAAGNYQDTVTVTVNY